jgi:hypothetical protein
MELKKWSPKGLVEYYYAERLDIDGSLEGCKLHAKESGEKLSEEYLKKLREELEREKSDETALLLKLATHDEMESVWKELCKRSNRCKRIEYPYQDRDDCEKFMIMELISSITLAIVESKQNHSKRQDDIEKYRTIAKAARGLAKALSNSPLDTTVYRWYPPEVIDVIMEKDINPEKLSGYSSHINDEGGFLNICKGDLFREDTSGCCSHVPLAMFFEIFGITPQRPVMSEILKSLAADADDWAEETKTEPRIAERSSISATTIFIRTLHSEFWFKEFGSPLYRTFASLCRAVLNEPEITADTVKDALKGLKFE